MFRKELKLRRERVFELREPDNGELVDYAFGSGAGGCTAEPNISRENYVILGKSCLEAKLLRSRLDRFSGEPRLDEPASIEFSRLLNIDPLRLLSRKDMC